MRVREAEIKEFIEFPYNLYKRTTQWVGDLKTNVISLLSLSHPFWKKAERKLFVVEDLGRIKGRIAAIINHAYNEFWNERCCFFGFFDVENDLRLASLLFSEVERYAACKGMRILRGPANPSSNYTWGLLIENFELPNRIMMPYNFPYYEGLILKNGYVKEKDLYAFEWKASSMSVFSSDFIEKIRRRNSDVVIENADLSHLERVFDDVKSVYNKAWENNWGFVPMSDDEIRVMAQELKTILKNDYLIFARNKKGEAVAFSLLLPDFNYALSVVRGRITPLNFLPFLWRYLFGIKGGRMLTLGVNREYRGRGIEILIIMKAIEIVRKLGWEWAELSWTLEDNIKINKTIERFGGRLYKKYRIFRKDI